MNKTPQGTTSASKRMLDSLSEDDHHLLFSLAKP
jgi:hypothetical protein